MNNNPFFSRKRIHMKSTRYAFILIFLFGLSGCNTHSDNFLDSQKNRDVIVSKIDIFKEKQLQCLDQIEVLKVHVPNKSDEFIRDYKRIIEQQTFLIQNIEVMDKDSFVYLSSSLLMKLETLCNKIEFTNFTVTKQRTQTLIDQLN